MDTASRHDRRTCFIIGGAISVLISAVYLVLRPGATGAIAALGRGLLYAGLPGLIAGYMVSAFVTMNPHGEIMGVVIASAVIVNSGLYALVTFAILRIVRAATRTG